jgi:hypothetical protein
VPGANAIPNDSSSPETRFIAISFLISLTQASSLPFAPLCGISTASSARQTMADMPHVPVAGDLTIDLEDIVGIWMIRHR